MLKSIDEEYRKTNINMAKYINSADLCLSGHFSNKTERANREIPGKAFTYRIMGRKMILGKSEANQEIFIEDNKNIFYVERGNSEKLAKKIEEIWRENKNE